MSPTARLALALALALGGACRKRPGEALDGASDARASARPAAVALQLPPTLDRWRPWATVHAGASSDTAVVLVHQLGSSRAEWSGLVARLQREPAVTTLALDLRGHGDSVVGPRGARDDTVRWESFGSDPARWAGAALDVMAAVRYLREQGARRVVAVGAGFGATAVLLAATHARQQEAPLDGLALVSPGVAYRGVDAREPMLRYLASRRGLFMMAGALDPLGGDAVAALVPGNLPDVEAVVFPGASAHGVALCNATPARWERLEQWVRRALSPPAPSADAATPAPDASDPSDAAPKPLDATSDAPDA